MPDNYDNSVAMSSSGPNWQEFSGVLAGFSLAHTQLKNNSTENEGSLSLDMGINTSTPLDMTQLNRASWLRGFGISHDQLAYLKQVHGNKVLHVEKPGLYSDADGLITDVPDLALGILVADCAAILAIDPYNRIAGAFHAGWRGAVSGIVPNGINKMRELGAEDIYVWMSPCIGTSAFEVGEEVAVEFPDEFVYRKGFVKPHVDLKGYIRKQLRVLEIPVDNIQTDDRCTFENDIFHSYRRQKSESGRMMAMICIKR